MIMKWKYYYEKFCGESEKAEEIRRKDPAPMTKKEIELAELYFKVVVLPSWIAVSPLILAAMGIGAVVRLVKTTVSKYE